MADEKKPSHTLSDHLLGQDFVHEHDGDADHDHDYFEFDPEERIEDNPIWIQDHVTLVTVGIDIGSSGRQVIFSRINLRRYGEDLTSSYYVETRILNVDIGGGPRKLGIVERGEVVATAAVHIGGRLQVVDGDTIVRLDPAGKFHARQAGFEWKRGDGVGPAALDKLADSMADLLVAALMQRPMPQAVAHLFLTDPIHELGRIDGIMFSGGVGEYVYGREDRDFGDMGRRLGRAIRCRVDNGALPWALLPAGECIRA